MLSKCTKLCGWWQCHWWQKSQCSVHSTPTLKHMQICLESMWLQAGFGPAEISECIHSPQWTTKYHLRMLGFCQQWITQQTRMQQFRLPCNTVRMHGWHGKNSCSDMELSHWEWHTIKTLWSCRRRFQEGLHQWQHQDIIFVTQTIVCLYSF